MALNDKLINYGNLVEFHNQILNDTGSTTGVTWSANKLESELASKQDTLIVGDGIQISGNTISAIAIEDVSVLPDASANKNKLVRLASDKKVYVSEYSTITEEIVAPDSEQIDVAYLDDGELNYYKGECTIVYGEERIPAYKWGRVPYVTAVNAENINQNSIMYIPSDDDFLYITDTEILVPDGNTLDELTVNEMDMVIGGIVKQTVTTETWAWKPLKYEILKYLTYTELKALRDNKQLVPGQQYRITDYVPVINNTLQNYIQSAGHQFDIIVTADDVDKLNENARAIQHINDTYFADCKLESWKIKYSLDNYPNKFQWANNTNGKGVIYKMIDEWGNECSYDFKNIKFLRSTNYYVFTFNSNEDTDDSLNGNSKCNIIAPWYNNDSNVLNLNNNTFGSGCINNIFMHNCRNNTFGSNCIDNTLGNNCVGNTFGNNCRNNTFGSECIGNTLGRLCMYNTFLKLCANNIIEYESVHNKLGDVCTNNTFGNNSTYNTFGEFCQHNTFGENADSNTFSNACDNITFGKNCVNNTLGVNCSHNNFTTNYDTSSNYLKYINVLSNYSAGGAVPSGIVLNANYPQIVGNNSQGVFTVKNPLD